MYQRKSKPQYQSEYTTFYILRRLLSEHVKPYRKKIYLAIIFMVIVACCTAIIVYLVQPSIDQILITHNRQMLVLLPLSIIAIHAIKGIAEYYQSYLIKYVGQRILTDLQIKMYEHLLFADLQLIQSQSAGRLISRFTNDIGMMRGAVSNLLVGCAKHFLSVLFLVVLMFKSEPVLSIVLFGFFPLAIYPIQKLGRRMRKILGLSQEELGNYTARLDETFHSIKVVKSFLGEKIETQRARLIAQNILTFYKKAAKLDALVAPIMEILSGLAIAGILWYGGLLVVEGKTTPGELFGFITAFVSAYRPFKSLVSLNVNLQEGIAAAKRVFTILDTEPAIRDLSNAREITFGELVTGNGEGLELMAPEISFDNIALNFGNKQALKALSLTINKGKTTALIGRSGSGKTSLANLLVRFYAPTSGGVLINGHDIRELTISSLRRQIALVTQDTVLFDMSVAENIAYGYPEATMEQIVEAAERADAHGFISLLPEGYNTAIGAQGATLSGGQRQRLSIARAFLKNAHVLIMDEATSSLDSNSEKSILDSLKLLRAGRTTIVITHRLSSITDVDNIVVMGHGRIIEQGTHQELLAKKAEYYKLYNKELEEVI